MSAKICNVDDVKVFDGKTERCRCDGANVFMNFNNGAESWDINTDDNGLIPNGHICTALHANAKMLFSKWGYKNIQVKVKITWDGSGDSGTLGLQSVNMVKS